MGQAGRRPRCKRNLTLRPLRPRAAEPGHLNHFERPDCDLAQYGLSGQGGFDRRLGEPARFRGPARSLRRHLTAALSRSLICSTATSMMEKPL